MKYPSQDYLKSILDYNKETGIFKWRRRTNYSETWNKRYAGKPAGSLKEDSGYVMICIDYKIYRAHRLAVIYHYGSCECDEVDHVNGDRGDNRISNLRQVDRYINRRNMCIPNTNTSGVLGVSWDKSRNKWQAYINNSNGKRVALGRFVDFDEACLARKRAEIKYGFHENHGMR